MAESEQFVMRQKVCVLFTSDSAISKAGNLRPSEDTGSIIITSDNKWLLNLTEISNEENGIMISVSHVLTKVDFDGGGWGSNFSPSNWIDEFFKVQQGLVACDKIHAQY